MGGETGAKILMKEWKLLPPLKLDIVNSKGLGDPRLVPGQLKSLTKLLLKEWMAFHKVAPKKLYVSSPFTKGCSSHILIYFLFLPHTFMFLHPNRHTSSYSVFRILYPAFPLIKLLSFLDGPPKAGSVCFTLSISVLYYLLCNYSSLRFCLPQSLPLCPPPPALRGKDCILKIFKSPGPGIKPGAD